MRLFEIILLVSASIFPFLFLFKPGTGKKKFIFVLIGIIFILHLVLEGLRWQMFPCYILILIPLMLWSKAKSKPWNLFIKILITISYVVVLVLSWSLPMLLPVFTLPIPTGKFKIGAKYIHIETRRPEVISLDNTDRRELMLKVCYPVQIAEEDLENYMDEGNRLGFATKYGLPGWSMNYLDFIQTHTYKQPAIAKGKFPVLIFSHGHYSNAFGYYSLIEEIVSQGYIVININHTYESTGSIFPNGEIKLYNSTYDSLSNNAEQAEMVWNATQQFQKAENTEEEYQAIKDILTDYVAAKSIRRWSEDISSVIDHLENDDQLSFVVRHMKKSGLGVFGHSHGGAAAGQALLDDERIEAAINIDGTQWGDMINSTLNKPFASISSAWPEAHPNFNKQAFRNKSNADFYNIRINNTGHSNFMDIPLMVNIPAINEAGDIAPFKAYEITNSLILKFFNKYLLNKQNNIYTIENKFEEVIIQPEF